MRASIKRHKIDKLLEEHFWRGFWKGIRGGRDDGWELTYTSGPDWYDRVADLGEHAGWEAANDILAERERWATARVCFPSDEGPIIPGAVYAEAYGEARAAA
jgi:hypothetical protein